MLKGFLEFEMKVYAEKDIADYIVKMDKAKEVAEDRGMDIEDTPPPEFVIGKISIRPEDIIYYIETFSMEEKYICPSSPIMDNVTVGIRDSSDFNLDVSYADFERKLQEYYDNK